MSGQLGGQVRALPFTGFTALPFVCVGLALSCSGMLMRTLVRRKSSSEGEGQRFGRQ